MEKQKNVFEPALGAIYNTRFRTTLWAGEHSETTVMVIPPGGATGPEVYPEHDQVLRLDRGHGRLVVGIGSRDGKPQAIAAGFAAAVSAGSWINLINTGKHDLKLYIIYSRLN